MRLEQRRVLITGGGSGIGLALARALVPTNEVVIAGRDMRKLERAKADLPALYVHRLDVSSEPEARTTIDWDGVKRQAGKESTLKMQIRSYWLTIAQAALELKISTADVRRLIRSGKLLTVRIDAVDVCRVARDSVEYVKEEIAAGRLWIPGYKT